MRLLPIALAVVLAISFAACGGSDDGGDQKTRDFIATTFPLLPTETPGPGGPETPPPVTAQPTVEASGLQIIIIRDGTGATAESGNRVSIQFTGWFEDGSKFLSSLDAGPPYEFVLGRGNVIQGWEEGVMGMQVGEQRRLVVPPELAYGAEGFGSIPPNARLTYDVELVDVQ